MLSLPRNLEAGHKSLRHSFVAHGSAGPARGGDARACHSSGGNRLEQASQCPFTRESEKQSSEDVGRFVAKKRRPCEAAFPCFELCRGTRKVRLLPQCGSTLKRLPLKASNPHQGSCNSEHTRHRITSFQLLTTAPAWQSRQPFQVMKFRKMPMSASRPAAAAKQKMAAKTRQPLRRGGE